MAKSLQSSIKRCPDFKHAFSHIPFHSEQLARHVANIFKTEANWQDCIETCLVEATPTTVWEVAGLVFHRIDNPNVGIQFFQWALKRSPCIDPSLKSLACSSLLKLIAKNRMFAEVENLLANMKSNDLVPRMEALSFLVHAYAKSGLASKALEAFHMVVHVHDCVPPVIDCNLLLKCLIDGNRVSLAREVYDEMDKRDELDNFSVAMMVKGLGREGKVDEGRRLIEKKWGEGCVPNIVFYNTLIDGYCRKSETARANKLFKEMKMKGFLPNAVTFGALINGFCKEGNMEAVNRLLVEMNDRGLVISVRIYNIIIDTWIKQGRRIDSMEILRWMNEKQERGPNIVTYNTLISGLCSRGEYDEIEKLLQHAREKNDMKLNKYSYTLLMGVQCKQGNYARALELLVEMTERGQTPDLISYGVLVHGLVAGGEVDIALTVKEEMLKRGVQPDAAVYNVLMNGLYKKGRMTMAKLLLDEMHQQNIPIDAFVNATLIDGFIRCNDLKEAQKLCELAFAKGTNPPCIVELNALIKGYCRCGRMEDAMQCYRRMTEGNPLPDEFTYSTLIDGYVKQNDMTGALSMLGQMMKRKCNPNVVTYTSLIHGLCNNGDSSRAERMLQGMRRLGSQPNVVTYSILVGSSCRDGKLAKACSFFEFMLINKCMPNDVTFNNLINGFVNNKIDANQICNEAISSAHGEEMETARFLRVFRCVISDEHDIRKAVYNSTLLYLCQCKMTDTALQLKEKLTQKGFVADAVSFAAILHGLCLENRLQQWNNLACFNLNKSELRSALAHSLKWNQQLAPHAAPALEASHLLRNLIEH